MRRFSEMSPRRIGLIGIAIVVVVLTVTLNLGPLTSLVAGSTYQAAFTNAAGLTAGSEVRVSGLQVGSVQSVDIDGTRVIAEFTASDVRLGTLTSAAIKTETVLGGRFLELTPGGEAELLADDVIPVERTDTPYRLTEAVQDTAATAGKIDTRRLAESFDTLTATFASTPEKLRGTLDGVRRLSQTIAARDEALGKLVSRAEDVTGVLAERSAQITTIFADGNRLLAELEARREVIDTLLVNLTRLSKQISGLVDDNRAVLKPALTELQGTVTVLNKNRDNLETAIEGLGAYATSLGETVGGGPFFYALLQNLVPTNLVPLLPELFGTGAQPGKAGGSEGPR